MNADRNIVDRNIIDRNIVSRNIVGRNVVRKYNRENLCRNECRNGVDFI